MTPRSTNSQGGLIGGLGLGLRLLGLGVGGDNWRILLRNKCKKTAPSAPGGCQATIKAGGGGEIAVEGPPQKNCEKLRKLGKLRKNCGKIAVFSKGNYGRDLEKFWFPDSGQGKRGAKNLQVQTSPKPSRKFFFTYLWSIFTNFD